MKHLFSFLFTVLLSAPLIGETAGDHTLEKNPSSGLKPSSINPKLLSKPPGKIPVEKLGRDIDDKGNVDRPGMVNELVEIFSGQEDDRTTFEVAEAIEKVSEKIHQAAQKWGSAPKNRELAKKHYKETVKELISLSAKFCGNASVKRVTDQGEEKPKGVTPPKGLFDEAK